MSKNKVNVFKKENSMKKINWDREKSKALTLSEIDVSILYLYY